VSEQPLRQHAASAIIQRISFFSCGALTCALRSDRYPLPPAENRATLSLSATAPQAGPALIIAAPAT